MDNIPRKFGVWQQFDRYCKLVLYHEAIDYLREMQRRRDHEKSLEALSADEQDKLFTVDHYSSDSHVFSSHGYSLHIDNDLVATAFADILNLCIALDMKDSEIGNLMGMSRSSVQRRRTNALKELRTNLMAFMPIIMAF